MESYQQVHDFTAVGAQRFAAFMSEWFKADAGTDAARGIELHRIACLGVLEDNLNGPDEHAPPPLVWELGAANSRDSHAHRFTAELDDLIIETIEPEPTC